MIAILPADEYERRLLFEKAALCCGESDRAMLLRDGETVKGSILYRLEGRRVILLKLNGDGHTNREGLIRAALNAGWREGAAEAFCQGGEWCEWARKLCFVPEGEGYAVLLAEFFARKCSQER